MPLHYGSQVAEHRAVREHCGVFDVSHMRCVDILGDAAADLLRVLLANDVDRLTEPGRAMYSVMLTDDGGVVDDLICYRFGDRRFRLVLNCATADSDLAWIRQTARDRGIDVRIEPREELAILAVQGPDARDVVARALPDWASAVADLQPFRCVGLTDPAGGEVLVGGTGYTGEDGVELMLDADWAASVWRALVDQGAQPVGLGARDTLRLEAGLDLYGNEMDRQTSPLVAGLGWTVAWDPADRDFIGRDAVTAQRSQRHDILAGLIATGRGVIRDGAEVRVDIEGTPVTGVVTSGSFSPTLGTSIALARLSAAEVHRHPRVDPRQRRWQHHDRDHRLRPGETRRHRLRGTAGPGRPGGP